MRIRGSVQGDAQATTLGPMMLDSKGGCVDVEEDGLVLMAPLAVGSKSMS